MSDNEPDYIPIEAEEHSPPTKNLRRRSAEDSGGLTGQESPSKGTINRERCVTTPLPTSARSLAALKARISRRLHGQDYDNNTSLRVIQVNPLTRSPGMGMTLLQV
jgi:hypothetical protein